MTEILPSWKAGAVRSAILDFVDDVTDDDNPNYRPPAERIAVFDNDGTLWCEQPMQAQVFFIEEHAAALAAADPSLRDHPSFKAFLERDMKAIQSLGKKGIQELAFAVHSGMTPDAFEETVQAWLLTARHPTLHRRFTDIVYQPQIELLDFLRAHQFTIFIVSGGGANFMRAFTEQIYGVPPWQVIGSTVKMRLEFSNGHCDLMKLPELRSFDDREAKAENIGQHIGRRPILAFGNSDGDMAMMRYTLSGAGHRMAMLLHHDDSIRETAYDRDFRLSPLAQALDQADEFGFQLVSMKDDWAQIFPRAS